MIANMRYRGGLPSGATGASAAVVAAAITAAVVDHALTSDAVGHSEGFGVRVWIYAVLVLGAVVAATATAAVRRPAERRTIFANHGTLGVVLGAAHAGLLSLVDYANVAVPTRPGWTVVAALLLTAAAGGLFARLGPVDPPAPDAEPPWLRYVGWVALGGVSVFTLVTFVLAGVYIETLSGSACGGGEPTARGCQSNEALSVAALWTAGGAAAFAALGLVARRWGLALACLTLNALWLVLMVASYGIN
jgi:hypothetical protein